MRLNGFRYVYTRIFALYGNSRLVERHHALTAWLTKRHIDLRDIVFIGMSLDDPSITPSEHCRYDLGIAFRGRQAGFWARSSDRADPVLLHWLRKSPNATRRALPSATSSRRRNAPGTIYTGSGFRQAASCPRICRRWNCLYGFRRK
jgi:hypothetical protein